jgi:hypothetical protein
MFHRVDMHKMLMDDALSEKGEGIPVKMVVDHPCKDIDVESGVITFANGATAQHDVVVGADGVGVRLNIDISLDHMLIFPSQLLEKSSASRLTRHHLLQPVFMPMLQPQMYTG